jgi:arylsulfatase
MYKGLNLDENTQKYFGMCTKIDDNVGKLMSRLTNWGIEKNTLLIFMTDNGGTGGVRVFNDGMRGAKGTPYRGGTRVPAFFRWMERCSRVNARISLRTSTFFRRWLNLSA